MEEHGSGMTTNVSIPRQLLSGDRQRGYSLVPSGWRDGNCTISSSGTVVCEVAVSSNSSSHQTDFEPAVWKAAILFSIVAFTVFGNTLVILAVARFPKLRTITNRFIFSLAIADVLLGITVLPLSAMNALYPTWNYGLVLCNIYVSFDVMLCTSSILHLFAISMERYVAISRPLRHIQICSKRRVHFSMFFIWVTSVLISFIPLHLGWNTHHGHVQNSLDTGVCTLEGNKVYNVTIAVTTFFVPLFLMLFTYIKIMRIARRQAKEIKKLVSQGQRFANQSANDEGHRQHASKAASESKATVTVAAIVGAFSICWVPYFVIFTVRPFLGHQVSPTFDLVILWLGYINSMLNPLLYGFINREFRRAFKAVLLCRSDMLPGVSDRPGTWRGPQKPDRTYTGAKWTGTNQPDGSARLLPTKAENNVTM